MMILILGIWPENRLPKIAAGFNLLAENFQEARNLPA
jgi:hypothetical protein